MYYYEKLINPTDNQLKELIQLYKAEDWLTLKENIPETIRKIINGSHCFFMAKKNSEIIGMGRAISDGISDAYIQDVTVKKKYRNKKIGANIINEIILSLKSDNIGWIGLVAEKGTEKFYTSIGFKKMDNSVPMLIQQKKDK